MWIVIGHEKDGNKFNKHFSIIKDAKIELHHIRLSGGDGYIYKNV